MWSTCDFQGELETCNINYATRTYHMEERVGIMVSRCICHCRSWPIYYLYLTLLLLTSKISGEHAEWQITQWSECRPDPTLTCCHSQQSNTCIRSRRAKCVAAGKSIPSYICKIYSGVQPKEVEPCQKCRQDCVLGAWRPWSSCEAVDCHVQPMQYRTRDVIVLPSTGGERCNNRIKMRKCLQCRKRRRYHWVTGNWTSCRKKTMPASSTQCQDGQRKRHVTCVDDRGRNQAPRHCKGSKPAQQEVCKLSCDCSVMSWQPWDTCEINCRYNSYHGFATRKRMTSNKAQYGGMPCPHLEERRKCTVSNNKCSIYKWVISDWSVCKVPKSKDRCGAGFQSRTVYCHQHYQGIVLSRQKDKYCERGPDGDILLKPPTRRACLVTKCSQDCEIGQWENWNACSVSCGSNGQQTRKRNILKPAAAGGKRCPKLTEIKSCNVSKCSQWLKGSWTTCFTDGWAPCGTGERLREVRCVDHVGNWLRNDQCSHIKKPRKKHACVKPCIGQCHWTLWSAWTRCSRSCGPVGGVQHRARLSLTGSKNCSSKFLLRETKPCNKRKCRDYLWRVTAWEECQNSSGGACGVGTGLQRRHVTCRKYSGGRIGNTSLCTILDKPQDSRPCHYHCPVDCQLDQWSDWSKCFPDCGHDAKLIRSRQVIRPMQYGGHMCPNGTSSEGVHVEYNFESCASVKPCDNFTWSVGPYHGVCLTYNGQCGQGIQKRDVVCLKNDKKVPQGSCEWSLLEPAPMAYRHCRTVCRGDCELSQWSSFSACSQTCGSSPGIKRRTRHLINPDIHQNISVLCPHFTMKTLEDAIQCGDTPCMTYRWYTGSWHSCIPKKSNPDEENCGKGKQKKVVLCERSDGTYVPKHNCRTTQPAPARHKPCHVPCITDCQVSEWTEWSECSNQCGKGGRSRSRTVVVGASNLGRPCPLLTETSLCEVRPCSDYQWVVGQWSGCKVNGVISCGQGRMQRSVTCPAEEEHCLSRGSRPDKFETCEVPCRHDCLLTPWSDYGQCLKASTGHCSQSRYRYVAQIRSNQDKAIGRCYATTSRRNCDCLQAYKLSYGQWTTCKPHVGVCGKGIRSRMIECKTEDGIPVTTDRCSASSTPLVEKPCHVTCAVDCRLSAFTEWSKCSHLCGEIGVKTRYRTVLDKGNSLGRQCPMDVLVQNMTCNIKPCFTYTWNQSNWSTCTLHRWKSCGHGTQTRVSECKRNDGIIVDVSLCLSEGYTTVSNEKPCYVPCENDCQLTQWSRFGSCIRNCSSYTLSSYRVRARDVVKLSLPGGSPCPRRLLDVRKCEPDRGRCFHYKWSNSSWNEDGVRDVFCTSSGGIRVSNGCSSATKPSAIRNCSRSCGEFASCIEGKCICNSGFEGDELKCLPSKGCVMNHHCFGNKTMCDVVTKRCICVDGSEPRLGILCNHTTSEKLESVFIEKDMMYIIIASSGGFVLLVLSFSLFFIIRCTRFRGGSAGTSSPPNNSNDQHIKNRFNCNENVPMAKVREKYTKNIIQAQNQRRDAQNIYVFPVCEKYKSQNTNDTDDEVFDEMSPLSSNTSDEVFYQEANGMNLDSRCLNLKQKDYFKCAKNKNEMNPLLLKKVLMLQTGRLVIPDGCGDNDIHLKSMNDSRADIVDIDSELSDEVFIDADDDPHAQNAENLKVENRHHTPDDGVVPEVHSVRQKKQNGHTINNYPIEQLSENTQSKLPPLKNKLRRKARQRTADIVIEHNEQGKDTVLSGSYCTLNEHGIKSPSAATNNAISPSPSHNSEQDFNMHLCPASRQYINMPTLEQRQENSPTSEYGNNSSATTNTSGSRFTDDNFLTSSDGDSAKSVDV